MKYIIVGKLLTWVTNLEVDLKNKEIVSQIQPLGINAPYHSDHFRVEKMTIG